MPTLNRSRHPLRRATAPIAAAAVAALLAAGLRQRGHGRRDRREAEHVGQPRWRAAAACPA